MKATKYHNFTLTLFGIDKPDESLENALYEAGCSDATLYFHNKFGYLEFNRKAENYESAVISAIKNVEDADSRLTVTGIEPGDLVSSSELADRLGYSRQYISKLLKGMFKTFPNPPVPITGVTMRNPIFSFKSVTLWLHHNKKPLDEDLLTRAKVTSEIDNYLKYRFYKIRNDINHVSKKL